MKSCIKITNTRDGSIVEYNDVEIVNWSGRDKYITGKNSDGSSFTLFFAATDRVEVGHL